MIFNNILLHSDYHLFHKMIWIYEFEKRKPIIQRVNKNIKTKEELQEIYDQGNYDSLLLNFDKELYKVIIEDVNKSIKENKIREYYNLGDLFFNISSKKIEQYFEEYKMGEYINSLFDIFKKNDIKTTLFLGNHDNNNFVSFYSRYFNEIKYYEINGNTIFTHYPLFSSTGEYSKGGIFGKTDKEIINKIKKDTGLINYHGHTHSKVSNESLRYKGIKYINCSIEGII